MARLTCQLDVLTWFPHLHHLELWGSDFHPDLGPVLPSLGLLASLHLHHVDGIDLAAMARISSACKGLR